MSMKLSGIFCIWNVLVCVQLTGGEVHEIFTLCGGLFGQMVHCIYSLMCYLKASASSIEFFLCILVFGKSTYNRLSPLVCVFNNALLGLLAYADE